LDAWLRKSKLQTQVALRSTKSEHLALSQAVRKVKHLMLMVKEMKCKGFNVSNTTPMVKCTLLKTSWDTGHTIYKKANKCQAPSFSCYGH